MFQNLTVSGVLTKFGLFDFKIYIWNIHNGSVSQIDVNEFCELVCYIAENWINPCYCFVILFFLPLCVPTNITFENIAQKLSFDWFALYQDCIHWPKSINHMIYYHRKVLFSSFHINGHTLTLHPQTWNLESRNMIEG